MRALITGIGGFVGTHLTTLLRQEGFEVWGLDRVSVDADHPAAAAARSTVTGDVCDPAFTDRVVRDARPTHVFHLAGAYRLDAAGRMASNDPDVVGFTVLLESLHESTPDAWVMLASSSAVYGAPEHLPAGEDAPLKPTTPYGASKVAAEIAAEHFRLVHGMSVVSVRSFNLIGPSMPRRLFAGSLAAQIAAAERGGSSTITLGRLDSSRDYVDVRDAARAYLALATQPAHDSWVFNVCTGVARSGRELADEMLALAHVPVRLVHDDARRQAGDVDTQSGSAARLRALTGWLPGISFSASVRDTLDQERKKVG